MSDNIETSVEDIVMVTRLTVQLAEPFGPFKNERDVWQPIVTAAEFSFHETLGDDRVVEPVIVAFGGLVGVPATGKGSPSKRQRKYDSVYIEFDLAPEYQPLRDALLEKAAEAFRELNPHARDYDIDFKGSLT